MSRFSLILLCIIAFSFSSCVERENAFRIQPTSLDDLKGENIAVVLGSSYDNYLTSHYKHYKVNRFDNPTLVLNAVEIGRCKYAVLDSICITYAFSEKKNMEVCFTLPFGTMSAFGFVKGESTLVNKLDDFLREIKSNGTLDSIFARWDRYGIEDVEMPHIERFTEGEPIRVGIVSGFIPTAFVAEDGVVGVEPEILYRFAAHCKRPIQFFEYDMNALSAGLQSARIDIASAMTLYSIDYEDYIQFSQIFRTGKGCCVSKVGDNKIEGTIFVYLWQRFKRNFIVEKRYMLVLEGIAATLIISILGLLFGSLLGVGLSIVLLHGPYWIQKIIKKLSLLLYGVPMLVWLILMFYLLLAGSSFTSLAICVFTFVIYFGFISAEIFASGVRSVDEGQRHAAHTLGMTRWQILRYIVIPQAFNHSIVNYNSEAISLIKETQIVGFIAVVDLTKAIDIVQSRTFDALFPVLIAAIIYFIISYAFYSLLRFLKRKITKYDYQENQ